MEVYATAGLRVLLEDLLKQLQPEATHCQRPHPIPGRCLHHVREGATQKNHSPPHPHPKFPGGEEQMVSEEAPGHSPWSSSQESERLSGRTEDHRGQ